jgi:1-acyl-sn-glycerol-3-phosphate acyltransferase
MDYVRSISSFLAFLIIFILGSVIVFILSILTWGATTNWIIAKLGPLLAKPVLFLAGIKLERVNHGFHFDEPVIYIINHSSTLDLFTMIALGIPRIRFVAKWEIQYFPFFFVIGRLTGQVFIKRKDRNHSISTLQKAYKRIKDKNLSLMIAPEGSRKHEGVIGPFKKGAFRAAIDMNYPIVPIYFDGSYRLSQGGSNITKPGTVTAHIHQPIDTSDWSYETLNDHIAEVRQLYLQWAGVEEDISISE